ncbi:MAG: hypothetical protein WAX66_02465 [Patescibacteria group bacterium]
MSTKKKHIEWLRDLVLLFGGKTQPFYCFVYLVVVTLVVCVLWGTKSIDSRVVGVLLVTVGLFGIGYMHEDAIRTFKYLLNSPYQGFKSQVTMRSKKAVTRWEVMNSVLFDLSISAVLVGFAIVVLSYV